MTEKEEIELFAAWKKHYEEPADKASLEFFEAFKSNTVTEEILNKHLETMRKKWDEYEKVHRAVLIRHMKTL